MHSFADGKRHEVELIQSILDRTPGFAFQLIRVTVVAATVAWNIQIGTVALVNWKFAVSVTWKQ